MKQTYQISGMTCQVCVASVTEKLTKISNVEDVQVSLKDSEAVVSTSEVISISKLKEVLPEKYAIQLKQVNSETFGDKEKTKLQQLKPLLLVFIYLFGASFLLNYKEWGLIEAMLDFMGLFYIVFSFFKFLDLKGFPESFKMYDPLAKAVPFYGWLYPFIELILGLLFLMRFQIPYALLFTILILGITTVGVIRTLLDKKKIQCACLGTSLKLPMTEATLIENTIMLMMAFAMLFFKI